jgi:hypothetical protein
MASLSKSLLIPAQIVFAPIDLYLIKNKTGA